ncbi:MAG TPA: translation initiation factor IF-2 N-terminal domain-containing protein [Oculatellaceae cyanobacterium]|jgi:Translation initiation factor IF-2, N-terminal region
MDCSCTGDSNLPEEDENNVDKVEPETQTEGSGGGGKRNRPTRIGASTPDDSSRKRSRTSRRIPGRDKVSQNKPIESVARDRAVILVSGDDGYITVRELARQLGETDTTIIKTLFMMGTWRTVSQTVDQETAIACAVVLGFLNVSFSKPAAEI